MNRKAVIFGVKGFKLTKSERTFFKKVKPWGVILFSRNIKNIIQLRSLTKDIKNIFKDNKYPILIDQEGGRVSRLNKIIDLRIYSQSYFGDLFNENKKIFLAHFNIYINIVAEILNNVGVNINTVPVLDVRRKKSHKIIGDRAFSESPEKVSTLGNLSINFFKKYKIATAIKHIPGHGLANCDSHDKTPIINVSKNELINKDFRAFKSCNSLFAMTAHVIYSKYDSINTATHSKIIIKNIIRKHIKFKGVLISDDISMKSLKYPLEFNAIKALNAGCNLILHCNGNIKEMYRLAKVIPKIDKFVIKKTSQFYKFLG